MEQSHNKLLIDILTAINEIEKFNESISSFEVFKNNILVRKASERNLEIIGEAVKKLKNFGLILNNASKIISFRNFIAHEYDKIDAEIVWVIIKRHLPLLKFEVITVIESG
ncbi:MAG: HepT-like ribonuclease domain-containing protein [Bacteroidota bacterium]|nr:HepT-like ribonuclease domain-containing protein [Bacteroidota bacterium]